MKQQPAPELRKAPVPADTPEDSDEESGWEVVEACHGSPADGEFLVVDSTPAEALVGEACEAEADEPGPGSDAGLVETSGDLDFSTKESPASSCAVTPRPPQSPRPGEASPVGKASDRNTDDDRPSPPPPEEEPGTFGCKGCSAPIFKAKDIISSNYHAQTSPGYLLGEANGISISDRVETAKYTTGAYDIKEVSCERCGKVLGVTYCKSHNPEYRYKEGKFLVGSDRLRMPEGVEHPMNKKA